ncbi:hypothetical protein Nepgr_019497 [Nepenthes gracilis]|uniref:C3H1-type domain-containing protein n=1 Tax=Nepenthes gracilis TaxID=150966 RepID=A0AAD3XVE3_NEPGR|nr:hypothetical protein Nepgr_019497 [Nepenthes gracilis]
MDVPHLALGNFMPPSETGDYTLQYPSSLPDTHIILCDNSYQIECPPPYKRPRNGGTTSNLSAPSVKNKDNAYVMYTTHHCRNFRKFGRCSYGDTCKFSHGFAEAQKLPPDRDDFVGIGKMGRNWNVDDRIHSGIKLCKKFFRGEECQYGERCIFLHERLGKYDGDLQDLDKNYAISIATSEYRDSCLNSNPLSSMPVPWKTKLCIKWEMGSGCPYELKNSFLLSESESKNWGSSSGSHLPDERQPCKAGTGNASNEPLLEKKCEFKWKRLGKIAGIYADWIDKSPVHRSISR